MTKTRIGLYTLQSHLGQGGCGDVYKVTHRPSGKLYAMKLLSPSLANSHEAKIRFQREIHAIADLNHPAVIPLLDFSLSARPFIVMPLMDGSFDGWQPRSWQEVLRVLVPTLQALGHAHGHGVLHRDLKPGNLLHREGGLFLADFGTAQVLASQTEITGTPLFMAPEQWLGRTWRQGPFTDLYALGILIWIWATGAPPFQGDVTALRRQHALSPLPEFQPKFSVPQNLSSTLHQLLRKDPNDRPRCAASVLWSLCGVKPSSWSSRPSTAAEQLEGANSSLYQLQRCPLAGATTQQQQIGELIDNSRGTLVISIDGEEGSGRRRLAQWACIRAHEQGFGRPLQTKGSQFSALYHQLCRVDPQSAHFERAKRDLQISDCDEQALFLSLSTTSEPLVISWSEPTDRALALFARLQKTSAPIILLCNSISGIDAAHISTGPVEHSLLTEALVAWASLDLTYAAKLALYAQGIPGRAVEHIQDLRRSGGLRQTRFGWVPKQVKDAPVVQLNSALSCAAFLGPAFTQADWTICMKAIGEPPDTRLLRHPALKKTPKGWRFYHLITCEHWERDTRPEVARLLRDTVKRRLPHHPTMLRHSAMLPETERVASLEHHNQRLQDEEQYCLLIWLTHLHRKRAGPLLSILKKQVLAFLLAEDEWRAADLAVELAGMPQATDKILQMCALPLTIIGSTKDAVTMLERSQSRDRHYQFAGLVIYANAHKLKEASTCAHYLLSQPMSQYYRRAAHYTEGTLLLWEGHQERGISILAAQVEGSTEFGADVVVVANLALALTTHSPARALVQAERLHTLSHEYTGKLHDIALFTSELVYALLTSFAVPPMPQTVGLTARNQRLWTNTLRWCVDQFPEHPHLKELIYRITPDAPEL